MNATKLSEIIAPTRNIALNAIAFGTERNLKKSNLADENSHQHA